MKLLTILAVIYTFMEVKVTYPHARKFITVFFQWVLVFVKNIRNARSAFAFEPFFKGKLDRKFFFMSVGLLVCGLPLVLFLVVGYPAWFAILALGVGRFFLFEFVVCSLIWQMLDGGGNPPKVAY